MKMRITMEWLAQESACNRHTPECVAFVGDGFELSGPMIVKAHEAGILNADWLAERVLTTANLQTYYYKTAKAWKRHGEGSVEARAQYDIRQQHAADAYDYIMASSGEEMGRRKRAKAWEVYVAIHTPALEVYRHAKECVWATYYSDKAYELADLYDLQERKRLKARASRRRNSGE